MSDLRAKLAEIERETLRHERNVVQSHLDAALAQLAATREALRLCSNFFGDNILDCDGHLIQADEDSCPQKPECSESCLELKAAREAAWAALSVSATLATDFVERVRSEARKEGAEAASQILDGMAQVIRNDGDENGRAIWYDSAALAIRTGKLGEDPLAAVRAEARKEALEEAGHWVGREELQQLRSFLAALRQLAGGRTNLALLEATNRALSEYDEHALATKVKPLPEVRVSGPTFTGSHLRPDGRPCAYLAFVACNKCGAVDLPPADKEPKP